MREKFWNLVMKVGDKVIIGYYTTLDRIKMWGLKMWLKITGASLNIKGQYAYEYYKKIRDGNWEERDYIDAYEEGLREAIVRMAEEGFECTREQMAESMCRIMEMMGGAE